MLVSTEGTLHPNLLQTWKWGQLLELVQELAQELVQVDMNHLLTHQKVVGNSLVRHEQSKRGKSFQLQRQSGEKLCLADFDFCLSVFNRAKLFFCLLLPVFPGCSTSLHNSRWIQNKDVSSPATTCDSFFLYFCGCLKSSELKESFRFL